MTKTKTPGSVSNVLPSITDHDPIRLWRRRLLLVRIIAIPVVILCAIWALRPVINLGENAAPTLTDESILARIDSAAQRRADEGATGLSDRSANQTTLSSDAFAAVQLWNPPDSPESDREDQGSVVTPLPTSPPNLVLLGIIDEANGIRRAALYDQRSDQIYIVASGEILNKYQITNVTVNAVELIAVDNAKRMYRITMNSSIVKEPNESTSG